VSTNDCWAVGNASGGNEVIIRWDGISWARFGPLAAIPNTTLNSVSCVKTDDCWAVGNNSGGEFIIRWNGNTWTRMGPIAAVSNFNLLSISVIGASQRAPSSRQEVYP
jgi:hypothetical protein